MLILGISAYYHDSAAAIIHEGKIVAAAQEERFSRIKHDHSFPSESIRYCLQEAGIGLEGLHSVIFYDKPLLKFERILENYYETAPGGMISFVKAMQLWLKGKLFTRRHLMKSLKKIGSGRIQNADILFPEHHLSHAASAFYPSPFKESAILTIDGVGEWATTSICYGEGSAIKVLQEIHYPHSLGLLYSAFTYFLGFRINSGEYKLMGLAPYGNPKANETKHFIHLIREHLVQLNEDGSFYVRQKYFNYRGGLRMINHMSWEALFGFGKRNPGDQIEQCHCNLAFAIQTVTEQIILALCREAKLLSGSKNLCLAGGVALNCVANRKIEEAGIFESLYVQPAAGDAGGALGAALAAYHIYYNRERIVLKGHDRMQGALLGPSFSEETIRMALTAYKLSFDHYDHFKSVCRETARNIDAGKIVGWFQGRMEYGPRALGSRSILADARRPEMQELLNRKIKFRESFRPFAPAVLLEEAGQYFKTNGAKPYMLFTTSIRNDLRNDLPADYETMGWQEKLALPRSVFPAITHVDFSSRLQTVAAEIHPTFFVLLKHFKELSGHGLMINTSFNRNDEPIVCRPEEAFECFLETEMDMLVIGNFMVDKKKQIKKS